MEWAAKVIMGIVVLGGYGMRAFLTVLLAVMLAVTLTSVTFAGNGNGPGDGICPNPDCPNPDCPNPDAPDDDGDGIPNGQDDDYVPPEDGSGK
jgi:hypothetical protein